MTLYDEIPVMFGRFPDDYNNNVEGWGISKELLHAKLNDGTYQLQTLDIDYGNNCSLRCPHCFKRTFLQREGQSRELTEEELMKVILQAKELGLKSIKILGAGEPFENKYFLGFIEKVSALDIHTCIFTKGHVLGNDKLACKFNRKYGISTAKELVEKLYSLKTSILLGFNSFDKKMQLEYCGLPQDDKFDYYSYRNQSLKNLIETGFNSYVQGKTTRMALVASPYKPENIEEIFELFKWGRCRNIYVATCPSTLSGNGHMEVNRFISRYSIDYFLNKSIELYTGIYIWSIEKNLIKIDEFMKDGVSLYPGAHPCNQVAAGMYIIIDGKVVRCPGNDSPQNIICEDIRKENLKKVWTTGFNYSYAQDENRFNFNCIARDNELFNASTFYDRIYENVINHFKSLGKV